MKIILLLFIFGLTVSCNILVSRGSSNGHKKDLENKGFTYALSPGGCSEEVIKDLQEVDRYCQGKIQGRAELNDCKDAHEHFKESHVGIDCKVTLLFTDGSPNEVVNVDHELMEYRDQLLLEAQQEFER